MTYLWLALSILCEVAGTLSLRASDGLRKKLWLLPIAVGYLAAFIFLGLALAGGIAVGVAYGIWTATGVALVALFAKVLWKDPLTKTMLVGILLIMTGVLLVELG